MLLAIDTATRWTGLALHDGTAVIAEHGWRSINMQSVELAPAVDRMLARADVRADSLKGIAVALGPGSYTGLRIGLGLAKGIALAHQTPLIGVPTLDIVAAALPQMPGSLVVVAEAGRRRITAGAYAWQSSHGWQASEEPRNLTWEELLAELEPPAVLSGEISPQAIKQIRAAGKGLRAVRAVDRVRRSGYLAEVGWQRLRKGKVDNAAELTPIYLREP
ncbi:MAG TPA: tRNA (adenosine(37)-N6)-threonylcarbamoyltransferase complex dimerization subunit type 1 TsaB [Candidatus Binatia bacterium]|nr:tRNA (adenosine(37)-N6)-threonylcarbamoyltransferase complex dimerization subunit type 1 TsaB [Candidatus Binatia bacterium]